MKVGRFKDQCKYIAEGLGYVPSIDQLNAEPNFRNADPIFCLEKGGPIVKELVRRVMEHPMYNSLRQKCPTLRPIVDVRVNYLVNGTYPSLPGWHCDDIVRETNYHQPDVENGEDTHHFMCLIADSMQANSNTQFLHGEYDIPYDEKNVYKSINKYLELPDNKEKFKSRVIVKNNQILYFNNKALHRALPAKRYGVRMFFRLSLTYRKVANEVRKYNQCYVDTNKAGW